MGGRIDKVERHKLEIHHVNFTQRYSIPSINQVSQEFLKGTVSCLPGAVVEVRVPRGPGAVEGKGQLLVVLVLLTPHPKGSEHFDCCARETIIAC